MTLIIDNRMLYSVEKNIFGTFVAHLYFLHVYEGPNKYNESLSEPGRSNRAPEELP